MSGPTEQERELRSGLYKGVRVPASLMPVDDPAHTAGLRWFREGVDAALDTVQASVDHAVAVLGDSRVQQGAVPAVLPVVYGDDPVRQVHCLDRTLHSSHYWNQGPARPEALYCPGWPL